MQTPSNTNGQTDGPSTTVSLSNEDGDLALIRIFLQRKGLIRGDESPDEIRQKNQQYIRDCETKIAADRKREEEQRRAAAQEAILSGLRTRCRQMRIDPADMDEQAMRAAIQEREEESRKFIEAEKKARWEEQRRGLANSLFSRSGCPQRHVVHLGVSDEGQNWEWIRIRDLLADQARYASGYLIALLGKRGVGKTQLTVSVIRKCCDHLMTCQYTKALDLFRDFRSAYTPVARGERGEREEDVIKLWASYDLLVIDECHQRGETEWEQNTLINLLDKRYDGQKCTVLIANQTKEEFAAGMGHSVISRIHETGEAFMCEWDSYRDPKAKGWKQLDGAPLRSPSGAPKLSPRRDD